MLLNTDSDVLKRTYIALKKTQSRLRELEESLREPIAVVGMSCRLPGGANDPDKLWERLCAGFNAAGPIPPDRWPAERFYNPDPQAPGATHASRANFLSVPVDGFDAPFFSISA